MEIKGIDVSSWQDKPDWKKVSNSGIKFALLRVHQKNGIDESFEHNYKGCKTNGISVGGYKYSYALNISQAEQEAEKTLEVLNGRGMDFPIFYDLEWSDQRSLGSKKIEQIALAFIKRIKKAGYKVGIYCNVDWYNNVLTDKLREYDCWLAAYPYNDDGEIVERLRPKSGVGWQYSSKGRVSGINGFVDMNVFYKDYRGKEEQTVSKTEKAIQQMESWARDDSHGYDQIYRWGEKGDYDCSAAVIQAWQNAGVPVKSNGATYTGNMRGPFLRCGFTDVTDSINLSNGSGLKRGDVLLNYVHHTAMYCGNGMEVEASINEMGTATGGRPGDQTGREFLIRNYRNYPWNCVLRYKESAIEPSENGGAYMFTMKTVQNGSVGNHVLLVQEILRARGYKGADGKKLILDRECGANTVHAIKAYQKSREAQSPGICGGVDGIAGEKTLKDMIAL